MEIKKYLPISIKKQICDTIVANSIIERDGMKFIDYVNKELSIDLAILQFYTDMDIESIDIDKMYESGEINKIKDAIPYSELHFITENVFYMLEQEKEIYNSLSGVINRNLQKLIDKLPDEKSLSKFAKTTIKELNKINPDKYKYVNDVINALEGKDSK